MGTMIGIIFLILSLVLGLSTYFYLKKDTKLNNFNKSNKNNSDSEKKEKSNPVTLDEIKRKWGIKDIKDDMIWLENQNKVCMIMSINTIDFNMLSREEQFAVEDILQQIALSLQNDIQFYVNTQNIDTTNDISILKQNLSQQENPYIQTYTKHYMQYLSELMNSRQIYIRNNYIIVSYDVNKFLANTVNIKEEILRRCALIAEGLGKIHITPTVLRSPEIEDLLYSILNRDSAFKPSKAIENGALELYVGIRKEN